MAISFKRALLATVAVTLAAPAAMTPAVAQGNQVAAVEEIVVTARKRAENLQEIPLAITAFSADDISRRSLQSMTDIAAATPGMIFFENIQGTLATPVIRGLSQTVLNSPDRNVSMFYRGVFLSETNASNFDLLDIARVEVVKGPQSALYGRNSFAGAINYVPAKASTEATDLSFEATVGNYERAAGKASLNIPLGERAAVRLAAGYDTFDGTIRNSLDSGDNLQGYKTFAGSWDLLVKPTETLDVSWFGFYTDDERENTGNFEFPNNCGRLSATNPGASFFCGAVPAVGFSGADPRAIGNERDGYIMGLEANWDVDFATVTLMGALVDLTQTVYGDNDRQLDGQGTLYGIANGSPFGPAVRFQRLKSFVGNGPDKTEDKNAELRIESKADQRLRWLVGTSYYEHYDEATVVVGIDTSPLPAGQFPRSGLAAIPGVARANPFPGTAVSNLIRKDLAYAVYGTMDFDVTEQLTVGVELRHDNDDRSQITRTTGLRQARTDKYETMRFSIDYKATDDVLLYASAAKGYLAGFFNPTFDSFAGQPVPLALQNYDPSTNWTYEIGAKSTWLDGRMTANVAAFLIRYSDLHITSTPPPPLITALTITAAKAKSKGFEADVNLQATEQFSINAGYGLASPKFGQGVIDRGVDRFCGDGTLCTNNVGGKFLTRASKHTLSAGAMWADDLVGDWSWYARTDLRYQSRQFSRSNNLQWVPGRTLVNAKLAFQNQNLELSLWGKNIFNKVYPVVAISQPGLATDFPVFITNVMPGDQRTLGATVRYRF
jgi:iron complex outermembrane receptor protein